MTIKGPYLIEAKIVGSGNSKNNFADFTEAEIFDIYNGRATRQYLNVGEDAKYLEFVWFTDQGYPSSEDNPGPHTKFTLRAEYTYYAKAGKDAPAAETNAETTGVALFNNEPLASNYGLTCQDVPNLGKTLWRSRVDQMYDTGYPCLHEENTPSDRGMSAFDFEGRTFDFARVRLTVVPQAAPEYDAVMDLDLEAVPTFNVVAARYMDAATLELRIGTQYARTDDRWTIESGSYLVEDEKPLLRAGEPWGVIDGVSTEVEGYDYAYVVHVEQTNFKRLLSGRECCFKMHFNHPWNAANIDSVSGEGIVTVEADGTLADVEIEAYADGYAAMVRIKASNETPEWPDYVIVAMQDAQFRCDIQVIEYKGSNTELARFYYAPLDTEITFEAVGIKEVDGVRYATNVSVATCYVSSGEIPARVITATDGTAEFLLKYREAGSDKGPSVTVKNDGSTQQLSGRTFPSVFYGGSGTKSISLDGILVDEDGADWETLPLYGMFVVRMPGGLRYAANLDVKVNRTTNGLVSISLTGNEVDF